jgi:hypothetical protein
MYNFLMEYLTLTIEVNPWEGRSYEIILRFEQESVRQLTRFPLSPVALVARLPILRRALTQVDLGAGRAQNEDERAIEEFAGQLYRFLFSGETQRLFNEARGAAITQWKGLRLILHVTAPDLQNIPWEVLWDILSFDLQSMKRGLFDFRVERIASANRPVRSTTLNRRITGPLRPVSVGEYHLEAIEFIRQADVAFYSPNFEQAIQLYEAGLNLESGLRQARENLNRAEACLLNREPRTTVPPRAAAGYGRAWDTYTMYRFEEALRWLNEAWLLAKDWGIAEWPEANAFRIQIERSQSGYANFQEGLARFEEGDLEGALEAVEQAFRADPLEVYRAQLEAWGRIFELG